MSELSLHGRTALVTGASRGFGAGIAKALASEGAEVWLSARSEKELISAAESCGGRPLVGRAPESARQRRPHGKHV